MTAPRDIDAAMAMLGELIHDDRLAYGLGTVLLVLLASGLATWALLRVAK